MPEDHHHERDPSAHEGERLSPGPPVFPRAEPGRLRRIAGLAVVDIGPLRRHRDFRLLFFGQTVSFLGSMVTFVAVPFQAFELTGSSLTVGLIALAELVPILAMAFVGGALADAIDRRRMVLLSELGMMASAGMLLFNSLLPDPKLWVLFVVAGLTAGFYGIQRPSLDALTPRLVEREELAAASALASFRGTFGALVGPALAGGLIAAIGLPATYGFDIATYAISLVFFLVLMRAVPPPPEAEQPSLRGIVEGLQYARRRRSCSAPTSSTWPRCSSGFRRRSSPPSRRSSAAGREPSVCSTRRLRPEPWSRARRAAGSGAFAATGSRSSWRRRSGGSRSSASASPRPSSSRWRCSPWLASRTWSAASSA